MIEVDRVSKQFAGPVGGVMAVRDVSLSVVGGAVTGLLGPNGAGKTTLIRMITGFLTPTSGRVRVCGHDAIEDSGPARRCIGFLPESAPLYPEMRVRQFLAYRASVFSVLRSERRGAIDRALERCEVTDVQDRRIGQLSKGYRQRVGLAAAILHRPPVLILDEPSSGLDPAQIRALRQTIRELASEPLDGEVARATGLTRRVVLLSSHSLPEVRATCDRIVIMARGQVRASGAPDELLEPLRAAAAWRVEVSASGSQPMHLAREVLQRIGARVLSCEATSDRGVVARVEMHGSEAVAALAASEGGTQGVCGASGVLSHPGEAIAGALSAAGFAIRTLAREEPTLEDVFLAAVEDRVAASSTVDSRSEPVLPSGEVP